MIVRYEHVHEATLEVVEANERAADWNHRMADDPGHFDAAVGSMVRQLQIMNEAEFSQVATMQLGHFGH